MVVQEVSCSTNGKKLFKLIIDRHQIEKTSNYKEFRYLDVSTYRLNNELIFFKKLKI